MNRCIKCNVLIADNTDKCPLCKHVVSHIDDSDGDSDRYPNVRDVSRKFRLFENIVLFLSIVAVVVLSSTDGWRNKLEHNSFSCINLFKCDTQACNYRKKRISF